MAYQMWLDAAEPSSEGEVGVKASRQGILSCKLAFLNGHQPAKRFLPPGKKKIHLMPQTQEEMKGHCKWRFAGLKAGWKQVIVNAGSPCTARGPIPAPTPPALPKNSGGGRKPYSKMGRWCWSPFGDKNIQTNVGFIGESPELLLSTCRQWGSTWAIKTIVYCISELLPCKSIV